MIFITGHTGAGTKSGRWMPVRSTSSPNPFQPTRGQGTGEKPSHLRLQSDVLRFAGQLDRLTGSYSTGGCFDARLDEEVRRHRRYPVPMALAMVDVDRFQAVQRRLRPRAGDPVPEGCGQCSPNGAARRPGEMTPRYGGEEFAR